MQIPVPSGKTVTDFNNKNVGLKFPLKTAKVGASEQVLDTFDPYMIMHLRTNHALYTYY